MIQKVCSGFVLPAFGSFRTSLHEFSVVLLYAYHQGVYQSWSQVRGVWFHFATLRSIKYNREIERSFRHTFWCDLFSLFTKKRSSRMMYVYTMSIRELETQMLEQASEFLNKISSIQSQMTLHWQRDLYSTYPNLAPRFPWTLWTNNVHVDIENCVTKMCFLRTWKFYLDKDDMRISSTMSETGTPAPEARDLSIADISSVTRICWVQERERQIRGHVQAKGKEEKREG